MADPQRMWAHRDGQGDHLKLKVSIRIRKKGVFFFFLLFYFVV